MSNILTCANDGCENTFARKTHNNKYCSDECCKEATNRRVMKDYYDTKDRLQGKTRYCGVCKETRLNRYNDSKICSACKQKREIEANESVVNMLRAASLAI